MIVRGVWATSGVASEPPAKLRLAEEAELDAAERGVERRQPRADGDGRRHDPVRRRHARDIDDLAALQDRRRAGFLERVAELLHQRLGAVDPRLGREIGEAELEDARREREAAGRSARHSRGSASVRSTRRAAARDRPVDLGRLGQRHRRVLLAERAEDGEALGERRHEFLVAAPAPLAGAVDGTRPAATERRGWIGHDVVDTQPHLGTMMVE